MALFTDRVRVSGSFKPVKISDSGDDRVSL
jgi:hypothetical protein